MLLSQVFKSERIMLSVDRLAITSSKGYRMVRSTHSVAAKAWYLEVKVLQLGSTSHTRLGWATNMADLDLHIGCGGAYGYGYHDIDMVPRCTCLLKGQVWRWCVRKRRCARVVHLSTSWGEV
jgi:hypothetical protein